MFAITKIIHLLSLVLGLGLGIAGLFITVRMPQLDPALRPVLGRMLIINGRISFVCLILLWITGIGLFHAHYAGAGLSTAFALKLAAVAVMTLAAIAAQVLAFKAVRAQQPPPAHLMGPLGKVVVGSGILAVILAVLAFSA